MAGYKHDFTTEPNGANLSTTTAETGQGYIGDAANYTLNSGQLNPIVERPYADGLFVQVDSYQTNLANTQDFIINVDYDDGTDSNFALIVGTDPANGYFFWVRETTVLVLQAYRIEAGAFTFLGGVTPNVSLGQSYVYTFRQTPTEIIVDYGGPDELPITESFYTPSNKNLFFYISDSAPTGSGTHVTGLEQVAPDSIKPVITNNGPDPYIWIVGDLPYIPPDVTAFDNADGDITEDLVIGGDVVDPLTIGSYFTTYDVTDSAGNAADQLILEVRVQEPVNLPKIYAPGTYTVTIDYESSNCTTAQDTGTLTVVDTGGIPVIINHLRNQGIL